VTSNRVTTVVASRNRLEDLRYTLPKQSRPVVLVDNASTDGTATAVRTAYPDVEVVALPSNCGATARNVGVRRATTPYVAFADDDSWWVPGSLQAAAALLDRHPRIGLIAGLVLLGTGQEEDPVCGQMATSPLPARPDLPGRPVLGFIACAAVVRREAFLAAGGFDPVVFFGGEEARLAMDLATGGWDLCYVPALVVHHHPSPRRASSAHRDDLIARNEVLTAVMRRPWPATLRVARRAGVRGILAAAPRVPAALAARQRVAAPLEAELRLLGH